MPYSIRLPDGTLVDNIPDEVTPQQAKAKILSRRPDLLTPKAPQPGAQSAQAQPTGEAPEDQSILREVADVPLKIAGGAVTGIRMIADAFGADSDTSETLRGAEDWIADLYSAQSKEDSAEVARIMKEAEDKGVADQVIAGLKAFSVAPIDTVANALGTAAPAIVAGLVSTVVGAPVVVGTGVGLGVGALMGAGTVKSAIYDATKEILTEQAPHLSAEQIEDAATKAQEYGGENLDQILLGAGVGAVAARTGAEPQLIRQIAKGISTRAAQKQAAVQAAEEAAGTAAKRGAAKQAGVTAAKELGTEAFQGGQEQFAANLAQQRQGFDTPLMRGVAGQATLEGLAGAGMGALSGAREGASAKREAALAPETTETPQVNPEDVAAAEEYVASITGPDDTNDVSSEFHAQKLGIPLPERDENYLENLNAAIAAKVQELRTPATPTTPAAPTDREARIRQRADELQAIGRMPDDVAVLMATREIDEGSTDAQTQVERAGGDAGVTTTGRSAVGESIPVPDGSTPIQSTTPISTEAQPTGMVPDGTDAATVGGGEAGAPTSVGDVANQTAALVTEELTSTTEPTVQDTTPTAEVIDLADQRELRTDEEGLGDLQQAATAESAPLIQKYSPVLQGLAPLMNRAAKAVEALTSLGGTGTSLRASSVERTLQEFNDAIDALEKVRNGEMLPEVATKQYLEPLLDPEVMTEFEGMVSSVEAEVTEATGGKPAGKVVPIAKAEPTAEEQVVADEATLGSPEAQAIIAEAVAQPAKKRGGKREGAGRKAAELTPEEKEAKATATKDNKADLVALKREVDKAEVAMNEAMDTTGLEGMTGAELEREVNTRMEKLQQAANTLYRLHQRNKGRKQGNRARDLLKNENIPPSVLTEAKRRFEDVGEAAAIRGVDVSSAGSTNDTRQTVVGPVNDGIAKAKNAQQLLTVVAKHNMFFRLLAGRLRSFVAGVDVVVIETDSVLPAQLLRNIDSWNYPDGAVRATGLMVSTKKDNKRTIYLRGSSFGKDQGVNVVTALHEVLHAALDRKIKTGIDSAIKGINLDKATEEFLGTVYTLMDQAASAYTALKKAGMLPAGVVARVESSKRLDVDGNEVFGVFEDPYEFLAHGLTEAPMQSFLKFLPGVDSRNAFTKFIDAIRKVLGLAKGETNALLSLVNVADTALRARQTKEMQDAYVQKSPSAQKAIDEQKELDAAVDKALKQVAKSDSRREAADVGSTLQLLRDPRKNAAALAELFKGAGVRARELFGNLLTNDGLAAAAKAAGLRSVEDATNLIQRMHGMTGQLLEGAQDVMGNVYRAMQKDATLNSKLKEIIHAATIARVDPANNKANAKLNKLWDALGEVGQREYLRLRDYYKTSLDMYSTLLDKQIADLDLSQEQKDKLLSEIRKKFEAQSKIEPYFPLARFGEHWVGFGKGKAREFYMFETRAEQQALLKAIAKERNMTVDELLATDDVSFGKGTDNSRSAILSSSQELKELFGTIDGTNFAGDADIIKNELKDAVYQLYLASMPQQNLRKQFINRKDITGFETDVLRSFAKTASGHAYQLSRLAYMQRISKAATAARKNSKNNEELMVYSKELDKRVALEMDGSATRDSLLNKVATFANRAAYLHFLSGVSSALLQPMQLLTVGFNVLGARHGYAAATKELMRTFKIWNEFGYQKKNADGTISWVMPSIRYSKSMDVNPEERRALFDMLGTGVADETLNNEIVSRKTMPTEKYGTKFQQIKRGALIATTGLMHTTERVSREVMLLTSYRLSRAKGMSVEDAKNQAIADTYEGVGNMSSSNRPPIMRNPLGKVSLQFMMFPLYMASFLLKNFKRMIVPMNGQGRAEATKLFVGTMAATWVVAGSVGLPLFSMLTGFIGWAVNGLGDDDDEEMKTLKELGFETWVRKVWLPELVGHETVGGYKISDIIERGPLNAVTGLDFSSRLSLNDMFVRDRKETRTTKEGIVEMAMGATGPFGAQVMSYMDAYDALRQGDYQKAIEKSSPALIRNLALASKFAQEGAKDFRGAELIARDDYTTGMMIGQVIGFRSDKLANMQELGFKLTAVEQKINFQRTDIMNIADRVFRNNDEAGIDAVLDKIIKFNSQYPAYAITVENLLESLTKRAEQRGKSQAGVILSEKNLSLPGIADALRTVED